MVNLYGQINFSEEEKEWIREHPTVQFGYEPNWPPYEIYKDGEYTGIAGDYINLIEQHTGIDMQPVPNITWEQTIAKLKAGQLHVVALAGITDYRKTYLSFTKPYVSDPLVIVTRKEYQFISGLESLAGEKLSLPIGYYTVDMIKKDFPEIHIATSASIKECLLEVSTSRSDAFVGSLSVVSYYINTYGFANLKIAAPTKYEYTQMGLAVTKDWELFRCIAQKVFDQVSTDERNTIKNKWISVRYDHGVNKQKVIRNTLYIIAGFSSILLLFFIWNRTLKKEIITRKKAESNLSNSLQLIKQKNEEKEVLLREIHHRVKNNLQIVYSLLNMQSREVLNEDTLMILSEGKARIKAMALVHQALYQSDNMSKVKMDNYMESLKKSIQNINQKKEQEITISVTANGISLELDKAIPLGLILNELLTNSYKHAFKGRTSGKIHISLSKNKSGFSFEYRDNGVGVENTDLLGHTTLGMRLVHRLSNQLNSQAILKNDNGIVVSFDF